MERDSVLVLPIKIVSDKLKVFSYKNNAIDSEENSDYENIRIADESQSSDEMMEGLLTSVAARAALGTLLLVIHWHPSYLDGQCWQAAWILLALLRDCTLLPAQMVLLDGGDSDLLPPVCRTDFEVRVLAAEHKEIESQMRLLSTSSSVAVEVKKSSSILSLQG